jgi:hypothetical protein
MTFNDCRRRFRTAYSKKPNTTDAAPSKYIRVIIERDRDIHNGKGEAQRYCHQCGASLMS